MERNGKRIEDRTAAVVMLYMADDDHVYIRTSPSITSINLK
jgi:hypothetical protein